jgi:hypothetical protein
MLRDVISEEGPDSQARRPEIRAKKSKKMARIPRNSRRNTYPGANLLW